MTTEQPHPMVPPLELLQHWEELHFDEGENYDVMLIQAYQAGADRELEACCEWLELEDRVDYAALLHSSRRPQTPELERASTGATPYGASATPV